MRIINLKLLYVSLALAAASPLHACCPCDELEPTSIKFPGIVHAAILRGDYLLCENDAGRLFAVDLKRCKTFDLGSAQAKRWRDGDVADGQALVIAEGRLLVLALNDGKTLHQVAIGNDPVWAFGFAGAGRAFVHRGRSLAILELATGKTLHNIELGDGGGPRSSAWQKVGNRLFVCGPATTLCVIDLPSGKLSDRFAVDSRPGIWDLHVEGSQVYCLGSRAAWAARHDHFTCFDMEMKKSFHFDLPRDLRSYGRLAGGAYGTVYLFDGNRIDRFTMSGDHCGSFTTPAARGVLAIWHQRALIAVKDEIRLQEIKESPVTPGKSQTANPKSQTNRQSSIANNSN
jgi:hypothetical protein